MLGVVEELLVGPDGEARAVVLCVSQRGTNTKCLYQPVWRLYPLEMASERDSRNSAIDDSSHTNKVENNDKELGDGEPAMDEEPCTSPPPSHARRAAAIVAGDWLLAQKLDEQNQLVDLSTVNRGSVLDTDYY